MARLEDYVDVINRMDYNGQFEYVNIKKWIKLMPNYKDIINNMTKNEFVKISRQDLYTLGEKLDNNNKNEQIYEFIVKVLMWGYPNRSRLKYWVSNNESYILNICKIIIKYENYNDLISALKIEKSLGQSTYTKFLHFLRINNNDQYICQILDDNIRAILRLGVFDEFNTYNLNNRVSYNTYVRAMNEISTSLHINDVENLEVFLFSLRVYDNQLVLNQPKILLNT